MDALGIAPWTLTNPYAQAMRQHIRSQVDEQLYEAAWREGKSLTLEQAMKLAHRLGEDALSE